MSSNSETQAKRLADWLDRFEAETEGWAKDHGHRVHAIVAVRREFIAQAREAMRGGR